MKEKVDVENAAQLIPHEAEHMTLIYTRSEGGKDAANEARRRKKYVRSRLDIVRGGKDVGNGECGMVRLISTLQGKEESR